MCISAHRCANFAKVKMYGVQVFKECQTRDASGNSYELSMVGCKCIGAYVKNKKVNFVSFKDCYFPYHLISKR